MEITFLLNGKTTEAYLQQGIALYEKRLSHYVRYRTEVLPELKNTKALSPDQQKAAEGARMLSVMAKADYTVLLDERGERRTSVQFADFLQKQMNRGTRNLLFVVGGPYGFSDDVYRQAQARLSLSDMTFSHQMIRLFFTEQLYRAFTILKGEPYHNE